MTSERQISRTTIIIRVKLPYCLGVRPLGCNILALWAGSFVFSLCGDGGVDGGGGGGWDPRIGIDDWSPFEDVCLHFGHPS